MESALIKRFLRLCAVHNSQLMGKTNGEIISPATSMQHLKQTGTFIHGGADILTRKGGVQ